ncbi:MAG: signal peptidase I [Acidimicrobiia bacterium]
MTGDDRTHPGFPSDGADDRDDDSRLSAGNGATPPEPATPPDPNDGPEFPYDTDLAADPFRPAPERPAPDGPAGGEPPEDGPAAADVAAEARKQEARSFLRELPFLILGALILAVLIKSFLFQIFWIPSGSMHDTLFEGDRVIVNKLAYRFGDVSRGDVIVFEPADREPESVVGKVVRNLAESIGVRTPKSDLIKRVIGLPGETITIRDNQVLIDGEVIEEPYLIPGTVSEDFGPETIPPDHYFVMGDNRSSSRDSRFGLGTIERGRIIGKAVAIVWPPGHWGGL